MKTSELNGRALDWAVAEAQGKAKEWMHDHKIGYVNSASTDWAQGGPIIERDGIDLYCNTIAQPDHKDPAWQVGSWRARVCSMSRNGHMYYGPTPLIASMRCYVASKLGDEVEVPKELQQ